MKSQLTLIFLSLLLSLSAQQSNQIAKNKLPERIKYVMQPNFLDELCISEIERAKKDIAIGKIVFTQNYGFLFGQIRYEKELRELCKSNGLEFKFEPIYDFETKGQTQGCYGSYMDKIIIDKFGIDFKANLRKQADSIFLARTNLTNNVVIYYYCDERPRLPHEMKRTTAALPGITVNNIGILEKEGENGGWPFMDIGFIVDRDSTISNFDAGNLISGIEENKKYKEELFAIAVDYLKTKYAIWVPGKINGTPVRTYNVVRIYFVRSNK